MATTTTTTSEHLSGKNIISIEECLACHGTPATTTSDDNPGKTIFVDGSWHLGTGRDSRKEFEMGPRITGAKYFDMDDVAAEKGSDLNPKGLPHMAPPKNMFAATMNAMGITNNDRLILYGTGDGGNKFIPRVFYTFRSLGHPKDLLHMMEGDLKEWIERKGPIDTQVLESTFHLSDLGGNFEEGEYEASDPSPHFVDMDDVMSIAKGEDTDSIVVDARSAGRFMGTAPEPRPGLRGGHIPNSLNVPFTDLLDAEKAFRYRSKEEMSNIFKEAGVDVETDKKLILSCGSGSSACVLAMALEELGRDPEKTAVYDGSWMEWGADPDTPIVL